MSFLYILLKRTGVNVKSIIQILGQKWHINLISFIKHYELYITVKI